MFLRNDGGVLLAIALGELKVEQTFAHNLANAVVGWRVLPGAHHFKLKSLRLKLVQMLSTRRVDERVGNHLRAQLLTGIGQQSHSFIPDSDDPWLSVDADHFERVKVHQSALNLSSPVRSRLSLCPWRGAGGFCSVITVP